MIISDAKHLLFMEPKSKKMEPDCNDEITEYFEQKFKTLKSRNDFTKGWHSCKCGKAHSESHTFTISLAGKSYITNNLSLHYIKNHRSEVPEDDLDKIRMGMVWDAQKALSKNESKLKTQIRSTNEYTV